MISTKSVIGPLSPICDVMNDVGPDAFSEFAKIWRQLFRSRLAADAANLLPDGGLVIICDLDVLVSSSSSVHYDGAAPQSKRIKSLESDLKALRLSAKFSDFQIVCRGEAFPVHKAILATR